MKRIESWRDFPMWVIVLFLVAWLAMAAVIVSVFMLGWRLDSLFAGLLDRAGRG